MSAERIQKLLAQAGHGSRRQVERWIADGRIRVNGKPAKLGDKMTWADSVFLDERALPIKNQADYRKRVIAYHKPVGELVTKKDPEGRAVIFDQLPTMKTSRWISVGRLDLNTSGLILLTNDGELANRLMHPSSEIEREYAVRILGEVTADMLEKLRKGVVLEDGAAHFNSVVDVGGQGANHWYHVTLAEGRNREVRRLWESQGVTVSRLHRVRYGPVILERDLKVGRWSELPPKDMRGLYRAVDLKPPSIPAAGRSTSRRHHFKR